MNIRRNATDDGKTKCAISRAKSFAEFLLFLFLSLSSTHEASAQCLKIAQKVAFTIASEASYDYILSGQKFIKKSEPFKNLWKMSKFKMRLFREFSNTLLDEESSHVNFFWDFYHAKGKLWHPSAAAWQLLKGLPLLSVFWVENQISIEISLHTELRITWMLGSSFGLLNLHQCTASRKRLCISFIDTQ